MSAITVIGIIIAIIGAFMLGGVGTHEVSDECEAGEDHTWSKWEQVNAQTQDRKCLGCGLVQYKDIQRVL